MLKEEGGVNVPEPENVRGFPPCALGVVWEAMVMVLSDIVALSLYPFV